jgi:hypothetical protein
MAWCTWALGRACWLALAVGLHQRLRDRPPCAPPAPAPRWTAHTAASGTAGRAARRRPACCRRSCSASKKANSSAPSSALPGRQLANTTSATQIQPRPLTMLKKNALKADSVRNAPATPISAEPATMAPVRRRRHAHALAFGGCGFSPTMRRPGPAACGQHPGQISGTSSRASSVSGVCAFSTGMRQPVHRRKRRDGGRRVDLGKAHAVAVTSQRWWPAA